MKAENLNAVDYIGWGAALLVMEIFEYADIEEYPDSDEKFAAMLIGIASNAIFFFICYGILTAIGKDKEDRVGRSIKAMKIFIIISWILTLIGAYVLEDI